MTTRRQTPAKKVPEKVVPANLFFGRDESWLRFNQRVLEEAQDATNPLLERVKFLAITASNLDEFVEIRVAGILQRIEDGHRRRPTLPDEGGLTPDRAPRPALSGKLHGHLRRRASTTCWNEHASCPQLEAERDPSSARWKRSQPGSATAPSPKTSTRTKSTRILTPVTIDPSHPVPARAQQGPLHRSPAAPQAQAAPTGLKRQSARCRHRSALASRVVIAASLRADGNLRVHLPPRAHRKPGRRSMFRGYEVLDEAPPSASPATAISTCRKKSRDRSSRASAKSCTIAAKATPSAWRSRAQPRCPKSSNASASTSSSIEWQVFKTDGPVNLSRLMNLYSVARPGSRRLKYPALQIRPKSTSSPPKPPTSSTSCATTTSCCTIPFDSYEHRRRASSSLGAHDPAVISMKQTLYRTSKDSPYLPRPHRSRAEQRRHRRRRAHGALR